MLRGLRRAGTLVSLCVVVIATAIIFLVAHHAVKAASSYQPITIGYGDPHSCSDLGAHDGQSNQYYSPNTDTFSYSGYQPLGTFTWSGTSAHGASNVVACNDAPTPSMSWDGYGEPFQCEELVQRYAYTRWDDDPRPTAQGGAWAAGAGPSWGGHPSHFSNESNGSATVAPAIGDLLVWAYPGNIYHDDGHIAIITWVGLTTITTLEQNFDNGTVGSDTLQLQNSSGKYTVVNDRSGSDIIYGWLHDTSSKDLGTTTKWTGRLSNGALATFKLDTTNHISYDYQSAPGSTTWSAWTQLPNPNGDTFVSDPAIGKNSDGRLFLFALGTSGEVWLSTQTTLGNATQWGSWIGFANPTGVTMVGKPTVEAAGNGKLYLFVRDTAGTIHLQYQTSQNGPWLTNYTQFFNTPSGVTMVGDPIVTTSADGRVFLFVLDSTGVIRLQYQTLPSYAWISAFTQFTNPANVKMTGDPAVSQQADGSIFLLVRDATGVIQIQHQSSPNGAWSSGFTPMPNMGGITITGNPVVARSIDGRIYLFATDAGGVIHLQYQTSTNGGWLSSYTQFTNPSGVTIAGGLAAGSDSSGYIQLFGVGSDQQMYWSYQQAPAGSWHALTTQGGTFAP